MADQPTMEEEFREFVSARAGALLRTAYLLTGDWGTAEDLLQTALTKTYLAWRRHGGIEAVEPYTRRVLVNTATSWWRRRRWRGERPTGVLPERPGPDRHAEAVERDAMWQYVLRLPARQRAVLVLRFYEDLSEAQTAELLDISPGTVKSQTARALATLRKRLAADGLAPPDGRPSSDRSAAGGRAAGTAQPAAAGATPADAPEPAPATGARTGRQQAGTGHEFPAPRRPAGAGRPGSDRSTAVRLPTPLADQG